MIMHETDSEFNLYIFVNLAYLSCQRCNHFPEDEHQPGKPKAIYQLLAKKYLKSLKKGKY